MSQAILAGIIILCSREIRLVAEAETASVAGQGLARGQGSAAMAGAGAEVII